MYDTELCRRLRDCNPASPDWGYAVVAADRIDELRKEVADAYAKSAQVLADLSANLCTASALERKRLTAERDEARRIACKMEERAGCDESGCPKNGEAEEIATRRGWDCFKEVTR